MTWHLCPDCGRETTLMGNDPRTNQPHRAPDCVEVLKAERVRLAARVDELLAAMVRITRETPYPEEVAAQGALIAEVGTLRARIAEEREAMERVVLAARMVVELASPGFVRTLEHELAALDNLAAHRRTPALVATDAMRGSASGSGETAPGGDAALIMRRHVEILRELGAADDLIRLAEQAMAKTLAEVRRG